MSTAATGTAATATAAVAFNEAHALDIDNVGQVLESVRVSTNNGIVTKFRILLTGITDFLNPGESTTQFVAFEVTS